MAFGTSSARKHRLYAHTPSKTRIYIRRAGYNYEHVGATRTAPPLNLQVCCVSTALCPHLEVCFKCWLSHGLICSGTESVSCIRAQGLATGGRKYVIDHTRVQIGAGQADYAAAKAAISSWGWVILQRVWQCHAAPTTQTCRACSDPLCTDNMFISTLCGAPSTAQSCHLPPTSPASVCAR